MGATGNGQSDGVVEVEFENTNPDYPVVNVSEQLDCTAELEHLLPQGDGGYIVFYRIAGVPPEEILAMADECANLEATLLSEGTDDALYEIRITNEKQFFVVTLTDAGAIPRELTSTDGVATIVADVPAQYDASAVIDHVCTAHPAMEVVARRQKDHEIPVFNHSDFQSVLKEALTCRQYQVLMAAFLAGISSGPAKSQRRSWPRNSISPHPRSLNIFASPNRNS